MRIIFKNEKISEDVRRVLLEQLSARFKYTCFLNVVEEPEQNLYPTSQKTVLFELLKSKNDIEKNQPFFINNTSRVNFSIERYCSQYGLYFSSKHMFST